VHQIQEGLLKTLTFQTQCRYSELKPEDIDGNLFMYHLGQLIEKGYVFKEDKHYTLTTKGRYYGGMINASTGVTQVQPKLVNMIYCPDAEGNYLLMRWNRHPWMDLVSLPYGKMHLGASVWDMVHAELQEKAGLTAEFQYLGDVYFRVLLDGEVLNHLLAHVFKAEKVAGVLRSKSKNGACFWGNVESLSPGEMIPGLRDVINLVKRPHKQHFFEEFLIEL
jgi:ADP-ribose pyrophosphatase YjhB (NUDIX family)